MSDWNRTSKKKPPEEWASVLGWDLARGYSICHWYKHASGTVVWSVNGTSGGPVKPPTYWRSLPAIPLVERRKL